MPLRFATLGLPAALAICACNAEIDPFQNTDLAFSIYGHLDPARDTQWVRVAPLRASPFVTTTEPVDAVVTIEDVATGRTIEMTPVLFSQGSGNFGDTLYAYNFRTDEPIEPGATYRFTALRSDGAASTKVVEIPREPSNQTVVVGISQTITGRDNLHFSLGEGDHLAMVLTLRFPPEVLGNPPMLTDFCRIRRPPNTRYNELPRNHAEVSGDYQINIRRTAPNFPPPCHEGPNPWGIAIIRSREVWPWDTYADNTHINAAGNITNGVGFLGGVLTQVVPYDQCAYSGPGAPAVCELYYGPETATLFVTPVNGFPEGTLSSFSPVISLGKAGEAWTRTGMPFPEWDDETLVRRFPGLLPGNYRIILQIGLLCEQRSISIAPGETFIEVEMGLLDPGESPNSNGCRER